MISVDKSKKVSLTAKEKKAIAGLQQLAKTWPTSLQLFGWSGSLCVLKHIPGDSHLVFGTSVYQQRQAVVAWIDGISGDGGEPTNDEVVQ
jgi:hypothetical protein